MSTHRERMRALDNHLGHHRGVIITPELHRIGFDEAAVDRLVARGVVEQIVFGAYRSRQYPPGDEQLMVAVCAVNESAAIGLTTAGRHFKIRGMRGTGVCAIVPHGCSPNWPGVAVRRTRNLDPIDVTLDDATGIRYTSPPRTVHDCADLLGPRGTESAIEQLLAEQMCTLVTLFDLSTRLYHPSRPGARMFRDVLRSRPLWRRGARSELERVVREAIELRGLPSPEVNARMTLRSGKGIEVDLWWPEWEVVGEVDHPFWHDAEAERHRDRRRDRALLAMGIPTIRIDQLDVEASLHCALDDLESVLRGRGWRPGS